MGRANKAAPRLIPIISSLAFLLVVIATTVILLLPDETREPVAVTAAETDSPNTATSELETKTDSNETAKPKPVLIKISLDDDRSNCEWRTVIDNEKIIKFHGVEENEFEFAAKTAGKTKVDFYCDTKKKESSEAAYSYEVIIDSDLRAKVTELE